MVLVTLVLWRVDLSAALVSLRGLPAWALALAAVTALSEELLLGPLKWRRVARAVGCPLSLRETWLVRLGSQPLRVVLPLKSGELATALYLERRHGLPLARGVSTVLFEKAVNLWALVLLLLTGAVLLEGPLVLVGWLAWLGVPFVRGPWRDGASAMARRWGSPGRLGASLLDAYLALSRRELLVQLPLAVAFVGLEVWNTGLVLTALGAEPSPALLLLAVPASSFLNNLPVTILGIGVREGWLLVALGGTAPPETLLAGGLVITAVEYVLPTLVGLSLLPAFLTRLANPRAATAVSDQAMTTPDAP